MQNIKMPKWIHGICEGCDIMDEFLVDQYGGMTPCRNCDPSAAPSKVIVMDKM